MCALWNWIINRLRGGESSTKDDSVLVVEASANEPTTPPHEDRQILTSPLPDFIKPVASPSAKEHTLHHEHTDIIESQNRDPRRALSSLRSCAAGRGSSRRASAWSTTDEGTTGSGGLETFPELDAQIFIAGVIGLEHRNGAEHDVRFDPATNRVIKLTQPGEFGAFGGLEDYVQRLAWANEFFDDDLLIEGWLHYPNESAPRLVTSQPWYRVKPERPEPTMSQIDEYMRLCGFLKAYDGAWIHQDREIVVSDALPKNFVIDVADYVQAIDLIIVTPTDERADDTTFRSL